MLIQSFIKINITKYALTLSMEYFERIISHLF